MKKTTSKKSPSKSVKAVKRGKPKAAKIEEIKDNSNVEVTPTVTPAIQENIVVANSIEEAIEQAKNIQSEPSESIESNTEQPAQEQPNDSNETRTDSVSYADIRVPESKNHTGFYIGIAIAIVILTWAYFI